MSLTETVSRAIRDNLPAAVATELSAYLTKAEQNASELDRLNKLYAGAQSKLAEQARELDELKQSKEAVRKLADTLQKKEADADARQRSFDLEVSRLRQAAAEKVAETAVELARIVFRNPVLTYATSGMRTESTVYPSGGYVNKESLPWSSSTTVEQQKP